MKYIPLSGHKGSGKNAIVDDEDYQSVIKHKWHQSSCRMGYPRRSFQENGKIINQKLHSFLMGRRDGLVIDHINGNTLDNRRANLRFVTVQQNNWNSKLRKNNKTGVRGVYWSLGTRNKKHWCAQMRIDGKLKFLGRFADFESAVAKRKEYESRYYRYNS